MMDTPAADPPKRNSCENTADTNDNDLRPQIKDALEYLEVLKENLDADKYQNFLKIMKDMHAESIHPVVCVKMIKDLLHGHPDLLSGFLDFLPKDLDRIDLSPSEKPPDYKDALAFVRKIRSRFSDNNEKYRSFLYILSMYWTDRKSMDEVYQEVIVLFQDHSDLIQEFNYFIPNASKKVLSHHVSSMSSLGHRDGGGHSNTHGVQGVKIRQKRRESKLRVESDLSNSLDTREHTKQSKCIKKTDEDCKDHEFVTMDTDHHKNLNNMHRGEQGNPATSLIEDKTFMNIEIERVDAKDETLSTDKITEVKRLDTDGRLSKDSDIYRNNLDDEQCDPRKENSELDLSNCRRHTPSYCFLPNNYIIPRASYTTELDASVLNTRLVSVTLGSENSTFKFMRKNKYEKCLFRCEDDRFEFDVLLNTMTSTIKRVEDLLEKFQSEPGTEFCIADRLTSQHLRCIERLYADKGQEIVDLLHAIPIVALPVILIRLKQKHKEISRRQVNLENDWTEACTKYHSRSLDHRSFYFKQQDKKTLSSEVLLAECKPFNERMDDHMLLKSVAGNGHTSSGMVFEYADPEIHNVLYKIMDLYCGANCTSNVESDKIMRICTGFLGRMFGVISQDKGIESTEEKIYDSSVRDSSSGGQSHGYGCAKSPSRHFISDHTLKSSVIHTGLIRGSTKNVEGNQKQESAMLRTCGKPIYFNEDTQTPKSIKLSADYDDEREEGEISPEVHLGENNLVDFEVKDDSEGRQYQMDGVASKNDGDCGNDVQESCYERDDVEEMDTNHDAEISDADLSEGKGTNAAVSICHFKMAKPLAEYMPEVSQAEDRQSRIFYGSASFYLLFRLHQILYERILSAKANSSATEMRLRTLKIHANPPNHYNKFKDALYSYLNGSTNKSKFEDDCCAFVGPESYVLFTLDVLISKLVKQLQAIASNDMDNRFLQLSSYETSRGPGIFNELVYYRNACAIHDRDIFRFEYFPNHSKLTIQYMEHPRKEIEATIVSTDLYFEDYLFNDLIRSVPEKETRNVFLKRNISQRRGGDEHFAACNDIGRFQTVNGLECRILGSARAAYVLDTEDFLFRTRKRRKLSINAAASCKNGQSSSRVQHFRQFLSKSVQYNLKEVASISPECSDSG